MKYTRGALVTSNSSPSGITMSGRDLYPGRSLTMLQLVRATKMKLLETTSGAGGRCVRTPRSLPIMKY